MLIQDYIVLRGFGVFWTVLAFIVALRQYTGFPWEFDRDMFTFPMPGILKFIVVSLFTACH